MKENAGSAARAQLQRRLIQASALALIILALYVFIFPSSSSDTKDTIKSLPRIRSSGGDESLPPIFQRTSRLKAYQEWSDQHGDKDDKTLILSGQANLVDIDIHHNAFEKESNDVAAYKVTGVFCHVDFYLHKADPTVVPMFRDLISQSAHCADGPKIRLDLHSIVEEARAYDKRTDTDTHAMEPTGFVFHESRCGSTLVANSLMAMEPDANRVYSESPPPIAAAKAVSENKIPSHDKGGIQLLKDVIYMMGRTTNANERRLFFKIQSIGTKSINGFQRAFPTTPWIFVYRDPVQVMMSHLKDKSKTRAVCTRSRSAPPRDLVELVKDRDSFAKVSKLSTEDYCAAHLATLCEAAFKAYISSRGKGKMVNYENLSSELIDNIIPKHFNQPVDEDSKARILKIGESYSKARTVGASWVEDSAKKDRAARPEIRAASDKYLLPVFEKLKGAN